MSSRYAERIWGNAKSMNPLRWFKTDDNATETKGTEADDSPRKAEEDQSTILEDISSPTGKAFGFDPNLTTSWCNLYALIIPHFYVASTYDAHTARHASMTTHDVWRLINFLCFSTHCARKLWAYLRNERLRNIEAFCQTFNPADGFEVQGVLAALSLLDILLSQTLIATDDVEMYDRGHPFPLHNFVSFVSCMKSVLYD